MMHDGQPDTCTNIPQVSDLIVVHQVLTFQIVAQPLNMPNVFAALTRERYDAWQAGGPCQEARSRPTWTLG